MHIAKVQQDGEICQKMKPIFEKINKLEDQSFYLEEVNKPYFIDLWHFHPEIEILYVQEGFGTKYVGDSISSFYPGDLVIIPEFDSSFL